MQMMRRRPVAVLLVAIVGLLVAYPLSFGPAVILLAPSESAIVRNAFEVAYKPLQYLPEPFGHVLNEWAYFCGDVRNWFYKRFQL